MKAILRVIFNCRQACRFPTTRNGSLQWPRPGLNFAQIGISLLFCALILPQVIAFTPPLPISITTSNTTQLKFQVTNPVSGVIAYTYNSDNAVIGNVTNNAGLLSWIETRTLTPGHFQRDVGLATWLPRGGWTVIKHPASPGFDQSVAEFQNRDGVVCWLEFNGDREPYTKIVWYATCDPLSGWDIGSTTLNNESFATIGITNRGGVVAWLDVDSLFGMPVAYDMYYTVYDPISRNWIKQAAHISSSSSPSVSRPGITNSTVFWTVNNVPSIRGYDRGWQNRATPSFAYFSPSVTNGNPPLTVWFVDMSIATSSVNYNFGDGSLPTTSRSPYHTYSGFDLYIATQTAGASTHQVAIVTDTVPPNGSIVVSGGIATTTNSLVNLTLAATDNSGSVSQMRFSNEDAPFSGWEAYSTSKTWTMSSGIGMKRINVQFRDKVGKESAVATDTIVLEIPYYPADVMPTDGKIQLNEATAYGAAWKIGASWPVGPSPVPLNHAVRAAYLWVADPNGAYTFSGAASNPPLCWITASAQPQLAKTANAGLNLVVNSVAGSTAVCSMANRYVSGVPILVTVDVNPTTNTLAYAVEEHVPIGWQVTDLNNNGVFFGSAGVIKWGVFFDGISRVFSYRITPPAGHLE